MNPEKISDFRKLADAVKESYRALGIFREKRTSLLKAFVGSDYASDDPSVKPFYLYLLKMAADIFIRQIAVRAPKAQFTSPFRELGPMAKNFELATDDAIKDIRFSTTLRRMVMDSFFSPKAVAKIGLEYTGEGKYSGQEVDVTNPFVRKISFDDYVCDMSARSAYTPYFEGDCYYISIEKFKELYPKAKEQLGLVALDQLDTQDDEGNDRAESLSHDDAPAVQDRVALWDLWIPETHKLVTYAKKFDSKPLGVITLDAPEEGVYDSLWYTDVPDNAMPFPPFGALRHLHGLANNMFRRIAAQAERQKRVAGFDNEESAKRFGAAADGTAIFWTGQKPEELSVGGIDQVNLATFLQVKDLFSWTAGNLDSLGGLSPMAETAKQDEMLASSANAMLADMQEASTEFVKRVFRKIAWYEWTDPIRERRLLKPTPLGTFLAVEWTPETRQGDFLDFNFNINAHTMREESPSTKLQKILAAINNFYLPLQPYMQMQGKTIDMDELNRLIAEYSNCPELENIVVSMDPASIEQMQAGPAGNPTPSAKPAHTTRTYERVNRPGATRVGKDMALTQTLLGGNVQPSEAAAIGRPVG